MNVLYSGYRDSNHSVFGGYDKICQYPGAKTLWDYQVPFGFIPVGVRGKRINLFFLDIATRCLRNKYDLVHIFYGDSMLFFPYQHKRNTKIVATIHMDVTNIDTKISYIKSLRSLDGVVVLSSSQEKYLKTTYDIKAKFIPHGFITPDYKQTLLKSKQLSCFNKNNINIFYSGTNYRDFPMFCEIVNHCKDNPNFVFHAVGQSRQNKSMLQNNENVICYDRLCNDDYFSLLSECDWNFLPLTFATANNTLLEASFLGIRSILPLISGINDYAAPEPLNKFYSCKDELVQIFSNLCKSSKSDEIIQYSKKYEWDSVFTQLEKYYQEICS